MLKAALLKNSARQKPRDPISVTACRDREVSASRCSFKTDHHSRGIALILVTFILALASILVINLTYSTYIASRANSVVERSLTAEYLLKSLLNLSRALIQSDEDPNTDGYSDTWAKFSSGIPVPPNLLDIQDPNINVSLEIAPENRKFVLFQVLPGTAVNVGQRDALAELFKSLQFDTDEEKVAYGPFKGKFFDSKKMVAAFIDYQDVDSDSYNDPDYPGIEGDLKKNTFPNQTITRIDELYSIPGFTPSRMRRLEPFVTTQDKNRININFASEPILKSLSSQLSQNEISAILEFQRSPDGPFKDADRKLQSIITDPAVVDKINLLTVKSSNTFQIVAKVDYGTKAYFMRAYIRRNPTPSELPEVISIEFF